MNQQLLHRFFADTAERCPDAVAVDVPPGPRRASRRTTTYAELAHEAAAVVRRLRPLVAGEAVVAIMADRDSHLVFAAQLAVLESGAAYTCIDPAFPDQQVREILADAAVAAVLADTAACERLSRAELTRSPVIELGRPDGSASVAPVAAAPPTWVTPQTLAYVIYTSGTTGRPKGVMVEHAAIVNLVSADRATFGLGAADRVAQSSSLAYDSSIEEVWLAFASGATLVVADDETVRSGPDLVPWLRQERVTVLCPPPTLLRSTGCADPQAELPGLKLLYVGGEALPEDVASRWARGRQLVNGYGPTEATVTAVRDAIVDGRDIPIGWPVSGVRAWVLNEAGEEVPDGEQGELHLGGAGLARGYRNLPELTAAKFPVLPRLGRVFRTGDVVHRASDGRLYYHGRIDALVKVRGYRIELEAIETRLAECQGVRAAACRVDGEGMQQALVAFVVPGVPGALLDSDDLRRSLAHVLPAYMVPTRIEVVPSLPTTIGGKLDRARLPATGAASAPDWRPLSPPTTPVEIRLASAVRDVLNRQEPISIHDDFFLDLGSDSLGAAMLVSRLRQDPTTAAIATRDVYELRTVARLAERLCAGERERATRPAATLLAERVDHADRVSDTQVVCATLLQGAWLVVELLVIAGLAYVATFRLGPELLRAIGLVPAILLAPLLWAAARRVFAVAALAATVVVKALLIGRYTPLRAPAWGSFYVRNWIVHRLATHIPWQRLAGTELLNVTLRRLGARIGRRVHIHRGVDLSRGGWDLLEVGDGVTIARDAVLRLVDIESGQVVVGSVTLGAQATLDVRAAVGPGSSLSPGSSLTPWSSLPPGAHVPAGEQWDGIPAARAGLTPQPPLVPDGDGFDPLIHAAVMSVARAAVLVLVALPAELVAIAGVLAFDVPLDSVLTFVFGGAQMWSLAVVLAFATLAVPLSLVAEGFVVRLLGRTAEGAIGRWSIAYVRVWLKTQLLESAGTWLSGTLFWPAWLRVAGMTVGRRCEISTIIDTVPDLVDLGTECFLADGLYLAGPRIDRGTVTLGRVRLGPRTFVGNHAVIACGAMLPDDVLLGVCTVAGQTRMRAGTSWFGHPPFELPRRSVIAADRTVTHEPSPVRYWNRVFWELLRCALPAGPLIAGLGWVFGVAAAATWPASWFVLLALPAWTAISAASLCVFVLVLKWVLLGRVQPGTHPLWSCWCSRWDFLYVVWAMYGRGMLAALEGTLWLNWYLRAMGMTIGRRVLLGDGFAQVVDPDMLVIDDEATVSAMFQAHTFEERVLKIDRIHVGRAATLADGTVPLYGADIGADAHVAPHSVVLKRERLAAGVRYEGAPTRAQQSIIPRTNNGD